MMSFICGLRGEIVHSWMNCALFSAGSPIFIAGNYVQIKTEAFNSDLNTFAQHILVPNSQGKSIKTYHLYVETNTNVSFIVRISRDFLHSLITPFPTAYDAFMCLFHLC